MRWRDRLWTALIEWPRPVALAESTEKEREAHFERRWRRAEVFGLWAAAAVGVYAIWSSGNDAERHLAELRDEQRPWVYVRDPKLLAPLGAPDGASFKVRFTVANIGKRPAQFVRVIAELAVDPVSFPNTSMKSASCAKVDRAPLLLNGSVLFPAQEVAQDVKAYLDRGSVIRALQMTPKGPFKISLRGCAVYTIMDREVSQHQSGFGFSLQKDEVPILVMTPVQQFGMDGITLVDEPSLLKFAD